MAELLLPIDGRLVRHDIARSCVYPHPAVALQSRIAYSATPEPAGVQ